MGIRRRTTQTGSEAVAAAQERHHDLVLMDVQMPDMDGVDATAAVRAREAAPREGRRLPIIAMSANAFKEDRERCLTAGMDEYLSNPIRPVE